MHIPKKLTVTSLRLKGFSLPAECLVLVFCCLSSVVNRVQAQTLIYVPNRFDFAKSVSAINVAAVNTVITTLLTDEPFDSLTPDGTRADTANASDATLSVIDTATNTVTTTIPGVPANTIAITPDGTHAYVRGSGISSVIDTETNTKITTVVSSFSVVGVAITPDGTRAYMTDPFANTVFVIDTQTNPVTTTIPGVATNAIAITPMAPAPTRRITAKRFPSSTPRPIA